jgi:hypothetical protein
MNDTEFKGLHTSCITAFRNYVTSAKLTATLLEKCTPEPLPLADRLDLLVQERAEQETHSIYLDAKRILRKAARLGYHYSD